jgi:tetratricopeptide (TPR) repeat protein
MLGWSLAADGRPSEAIRAYERGIALDPDGNLETVRSNLGLLYFDAARFDEAYDVWATVPEVKVQLDTYWTDWVAVLTQGRLSSVPDTIRGYLKPEDLIHLGESDLAASRLAHPAHPNWISNLYRVWSPIFDPIRDQPPVQAYLRERGLGGVTVRRTPPEERELPAILRTGSGKTTP